MGIVKTSEVGPNDGVNLNLTSGPGGYVYVNGQIITGSGSVIIGPQGDTGATGSVGDTGATGATGPKGDTGNQGIPGIDGAVAPAGLTWSGIWNGTQSYFKNYVVGYGSASWWSKNDIPAKPFPLSPNLSPDIDSTNWAFLSIQGPVGPQGFRGATGPQGPTGIGVPGLAGINGATGATGAGSNLSYVQASTEGIILNDNGNGFVIPLADEDNAGLLSPTDYIQLASNPYINLPYRYIVGIFNEENVEKFTVLENTLGFIPEFVKPSTGRWEIISPNNDFIIGKTTFELQSAAPLVTIATGLTAGFGLPGKIVFIKWNPTTNQPDDFTNISGAKLEIRIYD